MAPGLVSGRLVKLVDRLSGKMSDLASTDGGSSIEFLTYPPKDPTNRHLFKLPLAGGPVNRFEEDSRVL